MTAYDVSAGDTVEFSWRMGEQTFHATLKISEGIMRKSLRFEVSQVWAEEKVTQRIEFQPVQSFAEADSVR